MAHCTHCGTKADEGAKYCGECGRAFGAAPKAPVVAINAQSKSASLFLNEKVRFVFYVLAVTVLLFLSMRAILFLLKGL